jgi:hypothetical protein
MPKLEPEQQELNLFFNQTVPPADSQEAKKLVEEAPYHPGYEGAIINTVTVPPLTSEELNMISISNNPSDDGISLSGWAPQPSIIFNTDPGAFSTHPIDWTKITTETNNNKLGSALKFDDDKLPVNLLSSEALLQTAAVLKFGADKYAEHNWRAGFAWSRPLAAAMRHIMAFNDGEDKDPESGLSHLAHAMCCIMFLLEFEKTHRELDDRYKVDVPKTKDTSK